jgi:hypothetical protein
LLALVVGCGSGGSGNSHDAAPPIDSPRPFDAKIDDAALDAFVPQDAPTDTPPSPATHTHFVIDSVSLPQNNSQAAMYGLDIDGNQTIDNQLGMVIATLTGQGFDSQATMSRAIDTGSALMLGDLAANNLTTASLATFTIYQGANPTPAPCSSAQDIVCRKHLTGSGSFSINPTAPKDTPLFGSITAGKLTAGPGHLTVQVTVTSATPVMVTLLGARVELTSTATSSTGKLAGAVSMTDINTKIIPAVRDGMAAEVVKQCTMLTSPPNCGCPTGSTAKTFLSLFDTNPQDCNISLTEVQNNSLVQSLLAPDVTVEGQQALSLGVGVHAVAGAFTDPM